jgi:polar amino acid transport system permease protein
LGFTIALLLGLALAIIRMSKIAWIRIPISEFAELIRGTPILVQLYFLFFILPDADIILPPFTTGVAVLGIHYATYCSEVFRAGLENVPRGQWEAARALNLSSYVTFRDIIIPQAIPPIVPALGNYLLSMFKETPILAFVAVNELMQEAKIIGAESFRYTEPITMAGIIFLILGLTTSVVIRHVEWFLGRKTRQS